MQVGGKRVVAALLTIVMLLSLFPVLPVKAAGPQGEPLLPYQDPSLSAEERALDLVARMTPEEKYSQLRARTAPAIPRLGVRAYDWWSECLHGVARDGTATSFPTGLGIAATWDVDLVLQMATVTSDEARDKFNSHDNNHGLSYWSPTINMARDPRWGRAEESYGEDPYLTGQIAEAFVKGLQGSNEEGGDTYLKAIATPKHFLGNNSESNRHTGSSNIDERDLREYYTYAFKNAVENGQAGSIMTSYNAVNGVPMTLNEPILNDIVRRTWGFDGYFVTDCDTLSDVINNHKWRPDDWDGQSWGGKEATAYAILAGVDLNCGGTMPDNAGAAVSAGLMSEDDVDKALVRLFTARMKTGEFDADGGPFGDIDNVIHSEQAQQLAENASDNAVVLLKNENNTLPLDALAIKSFVLVGDRADELELGDYSTYEPQHTSTALQGIETLLKEKNPEVQFTYIPGSQGSSSGKNYLMNSANFQIYDAEGVKLRDIDLTANSEVSACAIESGNNPVNIGMAKPGADNWVKFSEIDFTGAKQIKVQMAGDYNAAPTTIQIRLGSPTGTVVAELKGSGDTGGWGAYQEITADFKDGGFDQLQQDVYIVVKETGADAGFTDEEAQTIRDADVVVFFAGTRQGENGYFENTDGYNLDLPNKQTDLIRAVLDLNENTIVYMQAVSQINVEPFKDDVKALLWSTYNGQAQGNAAARILFGDANPSAKLPFTWYTDINELADVKDYTLRADGENKGRTYQYFTGSVTYPFGYGLSYSSFTYDNLKISTSAVTPNDTITVEFDVTNNSKVDGQEVAELYIVSPDASANERPVKRLKGFDKKMIGAEQTEHFVLTLPMEDLWYWDAENGVQTYDQGEYTIQVGPDSATVSLEGTFALSGELDKALHVATAIPSGHILDVTNPDKTITTELTAAYNDQTFVDLAASDVAVAYTSSKPAVAEVDENGVVRAVGGGLTTITASVTVNGETKTDSYPVLVRETIGASEITVGGRALEGFAPEQTAYTVLVSSFDALPEVAATAANGIDVAVVQASKENPVATITLQKGENKLIYTITFRMELQNFDFTTATEDTLRAVWSVIRENQDSWALDENGLTIKTEMGDLYTNTNTAKNLFYQEAPGDWEVEVAIELSAEPSKSYQQVGLLAYQDDDNYLKLGYQGNDSGRKRVEINCETGGSFTDQAPFAQDFSGTTLWLRLKKVGNTYTGSYSADGVQFTELGKQGMNLQNVKLVLTANNGTKDPGPIEVTFKSFKLINSGTVYDFRGVESLPEGLIIGSATEGGMTFGEDGVTIHTTGGMDNQIVYDKVLTGNWMAEAHYTISRPLQANWEQFGMEFVSIDGKNTAHLDVQHNNTQGIQLFLMLTSGIIHDSPIIQAQGKTDIYLRMKRVDDTFELYYSYDGTTWNYVGKENAAGDYFKDGGTLKLFATSQNANNESYDATIEYFKIVELGDEKEEYPIAVNDSGCCTVTYGDLKTVTDGGTVVFTVVPNPGAVISSYSMQVSGMAGSVNMEKKDDGSWIVTVSDVKSAITLSVSEAFGASEITVNGEPLRGFQMDQMTYTVSTQVIPTIEATATDAECTVTVKQATEDDLTAAVTVSKNGVDLVYTIKIDLYPDVEHVGNPYLPLWEHIPDGEPRVFEDPDNPGKYRVYIYGSHDTQNNSTYCGYDLVVWSAPVEDPTDWRYEGVSYDCGGLQYAPDVVEKDGKYYLYTYDLSHGNSVAVSDRPGGPFEGHARTNVGADPAVLVDDDGRVYAFWGYQTLYQAELDPNDMTTILPGTQTANPISNCNQEGVFQYYEGASIRKVEDMYVLVYCQKPDEGSDPGVIHNNYRARLVYAYSANPLGPWTYGGTIIDNGGELLADGTLSYKDGNNHGGIMQVGDQWYIFYHRMTNNSEFSRQAMAEPIEVRVEGEGTERKVIIEQAEMTSQGFWTDGLDAYRELEAGIACYLTGGAYITTGYRNNPTYNPIINVTDGVVAGYKYLNFGDGAGAGNALALTLQAKPKGTAGTIDVYIDRPNDEEGTCIGSIAIPAEAGEFTSLQGVMDDVTGKHAVFFVFHGEGGELCELNGFQFSIAEGAGKSVVSISGTQDAVAGKDTTYTVSVEKAKRLATATVWFEVDGEYFQTAATAVTGLNGFQLIGSVKWSAGEGSKWIGRATLAYLKGESLTVTDAVELLQLQLTAKEKLGQTAVTLKEIRLSGYDENGEAVYLASTFKDGVNTVDVTVDQVYSIYDVNRDGVVDQLDITTAQAYYAMKDTDEGWDAAKICDVNEDGAVGIDDLILIMKNIPW